MGSLSDNGGSWPPDGGTPDGLPGLPPEWGDIVVPDDLSELADEVAAVRAELRQQDRHTRWQRFVARPTVRRLRRIGAAAVRAPVLIVSMAVLVTVASLFASAWPGPARPSATHRSTDGGPPGDVTHLGALELVDPAGEPVPLLGELPAVILLVDECDCTQLVADAAAAVRPEVAVVTVHTEAPPSRVDPPTGAVPPPAGRTVRELRDPAGQLRADFNLAGPDGTAAALLIDRAGVVVKKVPHTSSVEDFRADLSRL